MIFVACGTHHQPFDRLVRAAEGLAAGREERVVLQRGASLLAAPHCEVYDEVAPTQFTEWLTTARIVVLHAGSSSYLEARSLGRTPLVVPRRPDRGEHVDDHQVRFADSLGNTAVVVAPEHLAEAVARFEEPPRHADDFATGLSERFAAVVRAWHADTRASRR